MAAHTIVIITSPGNYLYRNFLSAALKEEWESEGERGRKSCNYLMASL